jgi:molybdopterin-dependent oxidoreductase alpha subunit
MRTVRSGGGWRAIWYSLKMVSKVGWLKMLRSLSRRNACKTCALGMGGQKGNMVNEAGAFPEICKKSFQAMISDMQDGIRPDFFHKYSIAHLQTLSPRELESCGRLVQPLYAGAGDSHYRVISWEEAFQKIAAKMQATKPNELFFYASGRSSNEAGFLFQLLARMLGTNYVNNCSYYCHQASGVGLNTSLGTGTATVQLEDVEKADFFMLIGGNPASNHPRLMRSLMHIRRQGGEVVVVNPVKEVGLVNFRVPSDWRSMLFGSAIASLYVQPHIGGDIALLTGVAKIILERNGHLPEFIAQATEGFAAFRKQVEAATWEEIESNSGVLRSQITALAERYLRAQNAVFGWTMGVTHHAHGVQNVQMIVNLALLRGMVGRKNAGVLPIRGHSNVQGIGTVGVAPVLKQAILQRLEKELGISVPRSPGYDTMACMQAAHRGEMRLALCLGGNLYGSNPDSRFAAEALSQVDLVVYLNTTLNTTHTRGLGKETIILPVLARDEEQQPTTQESMFNYIRLSDGGPARHAGPRSEVAVLTALAQRVLGDQGAVDWKQMESHQAVRHLIARLIPGLEGMATIDETKQEFHVGGRILHTPVFPTPSGKAQFHAIALPELPPVEGNQFRLMTVRSEGQFNTVVYEEEDLYRGQERRDVILLAPEDITRLGWKTDQRVTVRSATGTMHHILVRPFDIRPGNALMYFPEANVLVPTAVDPKSKTPIFKCVLVTVAAEEVVTQGLIGATELTRGLARRKPEVIGS